MNLFYLLDYIYSCNSIPLWLIDKNGEFIYHSEKSKGLQPQSALKAFFEVFIEKATDTPALYLLNSIELYALFSYEKKGGRYTAVAGPCLRLNPMNFYKEGRRLSIDYIFNKDIAKTKILISPSVDVNDFVRYVSVILNLLQNKSYSGEELKKGINNASLNFFLNKTLTDKIFKLREEIELPVHDYEIEQKYLRCIKEGDLKKLKEMPRLTVMPVKNELSSDPEKQFLYEMIALITLTTRAAIEGGLDTEIAYTLSDLYIRQLDEAKSARNILAVSESAVFDFTAKTKEHKLSRLNEYTESIQKAIEYIRENLHLPISLKEVSVHASINDKYLSRLFIKETGVSLTEFVQRERIIEAKSLLQYSNFNDLEISNYLSFSSQSYFIKIFKKHTGLTPQQYRRNKYHSKE